MVRAIVTAVDGSPGQLLGDREQETLWEEAIRTAGAPELTAGFLAGEYRTVILALPERTRAAYLAVKRPGRGVRLNRVQRAAVWSAVEAFTRAAEMQGRTTFELLAARAADILADPVLRAEAPTYDHVVVDEAQDLHAGHWRVLRGLVPSGPDDLFLCEDGHQRIYGERTVLSRLGVETRGRSRRLTLNYRTSRQNLAFALGIIGDASVQDLDGEQESVAGYHSTFTGPVPALRGFGSQAEETASLVETVRGWLARPVEAAAIAVLSRQGQERARQALQEAGVAVEVLTRDGPGNPGSVKIASMHRAKGTEFSCVAVVGAEAGVVPLSWLVDELPEPERAAALGRERSLLYVACSRARDELVVSWSGTPSPLLPDVHIP